MGVNRDFIAQPPTLSIFIGSLVGYTAVSNTLAFFWPGLLPGGLFSSPFYNCHDKWRDPLPSTWNSRLSIPWYHVSDIPQVAIMVWPTRTFLAFIDPHVPHWSIGGWTFFPSSLTEEGSVIIHTSSSSILPSWPYWWDPGVTGGVFAPNYRSCSLLFPRFSCFLLFFKKVDCDKTQSNKFIPIVVLLNTYRLIAPHTHCTVIGRKNIEYIICL